MTVPKYDAMHKPILEALRDGQALTLTELRKLIADVFHLTSNDLAEMLPSGRQKVFFNHISWAVTYLKKAGLINTTARATYKITPTGLQVLKNNPSDIDSNYLMQFESFKKFQTTNSSQSNNKCEAENIANDTPDDVFEEAFKKINDSLADDLLTEVMKLSPSSFEQMVIDLLSKMGYGAFDKAGHTTSASGDEGIDGVIMEDKLGFSLIYIQAKKWNAEHSVVGRPDIQAFVGAISGKGGKGLYVTTASFSKQAVDYADKQHIILIDGKKLADLMIEYNFGVTVKKIFEIKALDTDTFNDYPE